MLIGCRLKHVILCETPSYNSRKKAQKKWSGRSLPDHSVVDLISHRCRYGIFESVSGPRGHIMEGEQPA